MKAIIISLFVAFLVILGALMLTKGGSSLNPETPENNVTIVDGKQIIDIRVKGGYFPSVSSAKAGIPTVLRFNTSGTFDCSSSLRIPSMNINKILSQTGVLDIDLGNPKVSTLDGMCGMGMYRFKINFEA